jgi:hypothetical protein
MNLPHRLFSCASFLLGIVDTKALPYPAFGRMGKILTSKER